MSPTMLKLLAFVFFSLFIISTSYSLSCTTNSNLPECKKEKTAPADTAEIEAVSYCYGLNSTHPFVCSGNGNCSADGNCTCGNGFLGKQCQYKPAELDLTVQIVMISFAGISAVGTIVGLSVAVVAIAVYLILDCLNARKDILLETKLNRMNAQLKKERDYHQV